MDNQLIDKWGEWIDVSGLTAGDSDVYYTFTGTNGCHIKGGKKNPLFGKRVNLTVLYGEMMDDIVAYIQSGEFLSDTSCNGRISITKNVIRHTSEKYGSSIEWMYNRLNDNKVIVELTTDLLFELMIDRVGDVNKIDWLKIFNKMSQFYTDNEFILICIANEILKGDIYEYFVINYNLRVDGVKNANKFSKRDNKNYKSQYIVLKWEIDGITKEKEMCMGHLIRNKRDWWQNMTNTLSKNRGKIQDYDKYLNGRNENEVLPNKCPIDNNIILNYTGIDFTKGNQNLDGCKNNVGSNETWSLASIDRIDSTKEYDYDNIQIISHYYNGVKNCASNEQITKLYNHQTKIKSELYPIEYMI